MKPVSRTKQGGGTDLVERRRTLHTIQNDAVGQRREKIEGRVHFGALPCEIIPLDPVLSNEWL
jgi:hypothetical protein